MKRVTGTSSMVFSCSPELLPNGLYVRVHQFFVGTEGFVEQLFGLLCPVYGHNPIGARQRIPPIRATSPRQVS